MNAMIPACSLSSSRVWAPSMLLIVSESWIRSLVPFPSVNFQGASTSFSSQCAISMTRKA